METINAPRIVEQADPLLIAGISETYSFNGPMEAPAQWDEFSSYLGNIPGQKENVAYGLCFVRQEKQAMEYICGVEVSDDANLPESFTTKRLPPQDYAVFAHEGDLSTIRQTIDAGNNWINQSKYNLAKEAGFFFERYGEGFNLETGKGDIEIWYPIEQS